jgi:D-beta-D-heptose 7-phosphate kinase/D-beta-D-heptose 1-phosphate adenosyltransferase
MSKLVFLSGVFDLVHPGHIELLKVSKSLTMGGQLVVGLDYDEKVRKDKGVERPINTWQDRKVLLESIRYVDVVVGFGTKEGLENLIEFYKPDILIDGGDWREHEGVGRSFAKEVRFFDRIGGYSSTGIIEKIGRIYDKFGSV